MKIIFLILGTVSVLLGIIGIILPGLPTTPFFLLAAILFSKGSQKVYDWFINHKFFGKIIKNYQEKGGLSKKTKLKAFISIWIMILISVCLLKLEILKIITVIAGLLGSFVMLKIPIYNEEECHDN